MAIYESDAVTFMRSQADNSVQLIWTDPPFGTDKHQQIESTGQRYRDYSETMAIDLVVETCREAVRVLTETGVMAICLDYRIVHQVAARLIDSDLVWRGEVIWTFGLGRGASKWWANKHNTILLFSKTENPLFNADKVPLVQRKWSKAGYPDTKKVASVFDITLSNTHPERVGYPNQKPLELIKPFVEVHTQPGDLVIDPFGGSGSTAKAAQELGRRWDTCDTNPVAVDTMRKRLYSDNNDGKEN